MLRFSSVEAVVVVVVVVVWLDKTKSGQFSGIRPSIPEGN